MIRKLRPILLILLCTSALNCVRQSGSNDVIVIAIEGDVDSFNPLFAEEVTAGEINDLLYPALVGSDFDVATGKLIYEPLLARSWEFGNSDRDLTFHLVSAATWSDGIPITARDVRFSYELYADPEVASVRQAAVEQLRRSNGVLEISKSVAVLNDSTIVFHFETAYPGQLFDAGLPILPAHVFEQIPRKEIRTHPVNKAPVASGPFILSKWVPLQEIVLLPNTSSKLPFPAKVSQIVFRILPDYRSRVSQLRSGEVDLAAGLRPEDAQEIAVNTKGVRIVSTPGRDYDFIGWNNIDPEVYESSEGKMLRPHKLFGSANVRRALTMAINRDEITKAYLGDHGQKAIGGVSPLFKWAYNDTLMPHPYDAQRALTLLKKEGWEDTDGDGVLDKRGKKFSFSLKIPSGNQLRAVIATVLQQQLRDVKIEMSIDQVERGIFWDNLLARKYDAWIAGFTVPLQMQLDDLWGSDLQRYPFNLTGFRNERVDEILAACRNLRNELEGGPLWKEFQLIVHEQQPCTFLFWIHNIVGVNERIQGMNIGVLGTTHKAWEWFVATTP